MSLSVLVSVVSAVVGVVRVVSGQVTFPRSLLNCPISRRFLRELRKADLMVEIVRKVNVAAQDNLCVGGKN